MHHKSCSMLTLKKEGQDSFSGMVVKTECPMEIFDERKVKIEGDFHNFSVDFNAGVSQKASSCLAFRVKNEQGYALEKVQTLSSLMSRETEIPDSFLNIVIKSEYPEEDRSAGTVVNIPVTEQVENVQGSSGVVNEKIVSDEEQSEEALPPPSASTLILNMLHSEKIYLEDDTEKQLLAAIGIRDRLTIKKLPAAQKKKKQKKMLEKKTPEVQVAPSVSPSEVRVSPCAPANNIPDLTKYMRVVPAFGAKRELGAPRYIVRPGVKIEDEEPLEKKLRVEPVAEAQEVQEPVLGPKPESVRGPRIQKTVAVPKKIRPILKERSIFPAKRDPEQQKLLKLKPVEKLVLRPPAGGYEKFVNTRKLVNGLTVRI